MRSGSAAPAHRRQGQLRCSVTISRAQGSLTFPASFQLVAAMNPCPCGYYGDPVKPCTCPSPSTRCPALWDPHLRPAPRTHRPEQSGNIDVPRVEYEKLGDQRLGEPFWAVQAHVEAAREIQCQYFIQGHPPKARTFTLHPATFNRYCPTPTCSRPRCGSTARWTRPAIC